MNSYREGWERRVEMRGGECVVLWIFGVLEFVYVWFKVFCNFGGSINVYGREGKENLWMVCYYLIDLFFEVGKDSKFIFLNFNVIVKKIVIICLFIVGIKVIYFMVLDGVGCFG